MVGRLFGTAAQSDSTGRSGSVMSILRPSRPPPSPKHVKKQRAKTMPAGQPHPDLSMDDRRAVAATRPKPPPGWSLSSRSFNNEQSAKAAMTIQRRYRRRFLNGKSMQERIIDFKYSITKRFIENWITSNLEGQVKADPWMKEHAQDGMIKLLRDLNAELLSRSKHETLEERDSELRETMLDHLQPENWPLPPSKLNPFRWLRARLLYAIMPADKNATYQVEVEPWMICVNLLLIMPGGIVLWFFLGLCILPVDDEYQLFNFIAMFKVYALVFWGLLPVWLDWISFYLAFTSGTDELSYTACSSGGPSTDFFTLLLDRMFATVWVLCWIVFARFKYVRHLHAKGQKPPVYTGDEDTGDREVTLAIKYDVAATALVVLGGTADLAYRILRRKTALAYFEVLWENILTNQGHLLVHNVANLSHGAKLFSSFLTLSLGFAALPWVLFKSPIGELLHQMRPTAYDASGAIRLQLDLPRMKKLEERRRADAAREELKKEYQAQRRGSSLIHSPRSPHVLSRLV